MGQDTDIDPIDRFPQRIRDAHQASIHHRSEIESSDLCGCFHCYAQFPPNEIQRWVDGGPDGRGTTAMCPRCDIDSVLGSRSGFPISVEFLHEMHRYWFTEEFSSPVDERPLASPDCEKDALSRFRLNLSSEEFAARFGHEFALFNFARYRFRTPGMTEWVDQLSAFFFAENLQARLRAAREKYLTDDEIARVEAFERDPF